MHVYSVYHAEHSSSHVYLGGDLFARLNLTHPSFCHQFTLNIAVGRPSGDSDVAGFGAGGPGCGMWHTLESSWKHAAHWMTLQSCAD